jgi:hypothetical protein
MSTLLIIHGDEGCPSEIHGLILLDQTLSDEQTEMKFEEMKDDLYEWIGDYSQEVLTPILKKHGLSGTAIRCIPLREPMDSKKMYFTELFY